MRYDCVIIGSGISGLASALFLAKLGKRVAIIERAATLAPLLSRFKRGEVWCDPGFHYSGGLHHSGSLAALFRYLGLKVRSIPLDPEGFDVINMDDDLQIRIPNGYDHLEYALCEQFPGSALAIREYLKAVQHINRETCFLNLSLPSDHVGQNINRLTSLREFLSIHHAEEKLIRLIGGHGEFLYGVSEDEVPMHMHAAIMSTFYQSAHMVISGGDGLVGAFKQRLAEEAVDIYLNHEAASLIVDEHRCVQGIRCENGTYFESKTCISTVHPQLLRDLLPRERLKPAFFNRLAQMQNTTPAFVLFMKADQVPLQLQKANYYHFSSLSTSTRPLAVMASSGEAEVQGKRSLSIITSCSPGLFSRYMGCGSMKRDTVYHELSEQIVAEMTGTMRTCFPELQAGAQIVARATPATYKRYTNTIDGSMYGIKQSVRQSSLGVETPVHNLFLAGQSIFPGVMGGVLSSLQVAMQIDNREHLWSTIQRCL